MTPPIIKRFLISLEENKWIGLLTFLFFLGVSGIIAVQEPPTTPPPNYKAIGSLSLKNPPPIFTSAGAQVQELGRQFNLRILLSPKVLAKVGEKLKFTPQQMTQITDNLEVKLPEEGQAPEIILQYTDLQDPNRAGTILKLFMNEMVEESRWQNTSQLRQKIEILKERLSQAKKELTKAEEAFYSYISKKGSSLLPVQDGSLLQGITNSQQQQRQIQQSLEAVEGQINSLVNQLGLTPDQAYASSALSADPIIASIRAQMLQNETQLELLSRDLRPEHPRMIELRKQQEANENLLKQRAAEVIGTDGILVPLPKEIRQDSSLDPARQELANTLVALKTQREGLLRLLESTKKTEQQLRQQYEKFPEQQVEQASLIQEVESKRAFYQTILNALVDAQSAEAETVGSLTVTQQPYVETITASPRIPTHPLVVMGAGAGLGLIAGTGVIFLLGILDSRLHTSQELRSALLDRDVLLLGELPFVINLDGEGEQIPLLLSSDSVYLDAYERLRSNIRRLGSEYSKVILITSVSHEEGKSITAYNLAIASAQAGKRTLLIEADLRSPSLSSFLSITVDPDAHIEPIRYYGSRSDCLRLVPEIENLYIVPSPSPQRKAAAIIESSELKLLIEDARKRFDMVVIDTPSLSGCNDALLLEPLTDGVVIVTRPGFTPGNLLGETIDQLNDSEIELLGGVINGVDLPVPPREQLREQNFEELKGASSS